MAMSLFDHHQRLHDLEVVLCALVETCAANPANHALLAEARHKLRARGLRGAAELLSGDRVVAAYRR